MKGLTVSELILDFKRPEGLINEVGNRFSLCFQIMNAYHHLPLVPQLWEKCSVPESGTQTWLLYQHTVEGIATASQAESLLPPAVGTGTPHGLDFPYKQTTNYKTLSVSVMKYCVAHLSFRGLLNSHMIRKLTIKVNKHYCRYH